MRCDSGEQRGQNSHHCQGLLMNKINLIPLMLISKETVWPSDNSPLRTLPGSSCLGVVPDKGVDKCGSSGSFTSSCVASGHFSWGR